jgi:hypothetical protein
MNFGQNYKNLSNQSFVWLGEYSDGTHLAEFDGNSGKENKFVDLRKDCLIRFGLVGQSLSFYHEILGGTFKLCGRMIDVMFKDKLTNQEYYLTGHNKMYCDVIAYKDAEALMSSDGRINSNEITQFNFGYKIILDYNDGTQLRFKALCHIPNGAPVFMTFQILSNNSFPKGSLLIRKNGTKVESIDVPLRKNVSGELNWLL